MAQVIIYKQENGSVAVCAPTGELPIESVLAKDCPQDAIIVDEDILPKGNDAFFFDAWELSGSTITVNMVKAKASMILHLNILAKSEANHRVTNTAIGVNNKLSDESWIALLSSCRNAIEASQNTTDLVNALALVKDAIQENA